MWVTAFVHREHGGPVLLLISLVLLLVGGGFGPPIFGLILGAAATRINAPLAWWRARSTAGPVRLLARLWPWTLAACVVAWLLVFPGTVLLDHFFGVGEMAFAVPALSLTVLSAFGLLLLTIFAGFARDAQKRTGSRRASPTGG